RGPVVQLTVGGEVAGQRLRRNVGSRGEGARGQDVVGRVGARQSEAGGGHRLPGADVLGVEVRRTAGEGDHIAGQHPGQGAGGEDGGRGAVVALAVGGDLPGERDRGDVRGRGGGGRGQHVVGGIGAGEREPGAG